MVQYPQYHKRFKTISLKAYLSIQLKSYFAHLIFSMQFKFQILDLKVNGYQLLTQSEFMTEYLKNVWKKNLYNLYQLHSSVFESLSNWTLKCFHWPSATFFHLFWTSFVIFHFMHMTHSWMMHFRKKKVTLDQTRGLYWRRSIEEVKIFNTVLLQKQDRSNFDTR